MTRLARVIVPEIPHHITQRGNRRQQTFFDDRDYRLYISLMTESCARRGVAIWAYCLMPNHVHLIAVPKSEDGLRRGIGEAHRRYSLAINGRMEWRGHLWQGRFASFPMDEPHLLMAARYVELNPVRARLVRRAEDYPWSSAGAHLSGRDDGLATTAPLLELVDDWNAFLDEGLPEADAKAIRSGERTGRPAGDGAFLDRLEISLGRPVRPGKRGPKHKQPPLIR